MDADFDLYGDADIYGGAANDKQDDKKDDQDDEIDYLAEANDNANTGSAATGSKRGRDDGGVDEVMHLERKENRYSSPGVHRNDASGSHAPSQSMQQSRQDYNNSGNSRMMEDTAAASDPSAARIALAGRPKVTDPNIQNALYVGELDWWVSDEDIRKIAQDIGIPISLSDVTFSEHKVNGKSKGVAYVETASEDEANQLRSWFENNDINFKRATITMTTSANGNPFRTLPKDPPPRENRPQRGGMRGGGGGQRDGGGMSSRGGRGDANIPMAGAPIRMGSSTNGGGMPMMNPMMMGMMGGGGGGRPPFGQGNPMFMGANFGGQGGGMGRGGYGRGGGRPPNGGMGQGHFNPNFFGGMQGQGGMGGSGRGGGGSGRDDQDRDRKRYRSDDNY